MIGVVAGVICFWGATSLKYMLGYDDSLDAFGVHGVGGIVGAVLTGVFARQAIGGDRQLLGELLSLVPGLTEGATLLAATAGESSGADGTTTTTTSAEAGSGEEVRTVLGEVLGLDSETKEITIPEEQESSTSS